MRFIPRGGLLVGDCFLAAIVIYNHHVVQIDHATRLHRLVQVALGAAHARSGRRASTRKRASRAQ